MRRKTEPRSTQKAQPIRIVQAAVALIVLVGSAVIWRSAPWENRRGRVAESSIARHDRSNGAADPSPAASNASDVASADQAPTPVRLAPQEPRPDTHQAAIARMAEKANSQHDDWQTEVASEAALAQLARLAVWLEQTNVSNRDFLASVVTADFVCPSLRPNDLREVYRDGVIAVRRTATEDSIVGEPKRFSGADGFGQALAALRAALGPEGHTDLTRHIKFKLYRIELDSATDSNPQTSTFNTLVLYEASIDGPSGSRQQSAVWHCRWTYPRGNPTTAGARVPLLTRVVPARYEEAEVAATSDSKQAALGARPPRVGPLFDDCTESALSRNESYRQQVLPGINDWARHVPREFMGLLGYNGLAVGDANGDGLDDLYVCDSGGLPNRLYVQQPDGTARDVSADAGVDFLDDSSGALLIDLDNDGDQDLVVAIDPIVQIAENDGIGRFHLHPPLEVNTDALSLCAADYDADGDLDVYVCGYNVRKQDPTDRGLPFPLPYHDANNGGRNVLLRNDGNFRFSDVTREVGLDVNNSRFSMAAAWEDFDNDGDQDLFVANDFGRKNLYQNNAGHFTDVAAAAGVEDQGAGMSVSWGDYNRDGMMDLYVGNMFSSAGNRITYQQRFSAGKSESTVSQVRRMARGNTLFKNIGGGGRALFSDVSETEAVEMGRWSWGAKFVELTNDGWPDLIVTNGYVSGDIKDDL